MIRFLSGTIIDFEEKSIILNVNGVGYQVFAPKDVFSKKINAKIDLYIYTQVREDVLCLYGFANKEELSFFEILISVSGVGPKMALEILNEPIQFTKNAIFTGNINNLTKISGIGKKLAERIVLELKSKVEPSDAYSSVKTRGKIAIDEDAILALESLGYKKSHIQAVFDSLEEDFETSEQLIHWFLQRV